MQSSVIAQNTQDNTMQETAPTIICGVVAHNLTDAQASLLSSNGINWVSSDVSLNHSSNWYSIYQLAKKYNLSLIGILDPYTMNFNDSSNLSDWSNTVQCAVGNYSDAVSVWEIWNEPTNLDASCGNFFTPGNATQYVDLMRIAYQIIKANNTKTTVLGLGGLPLYADNSTIQDALNFAQQVVNDGGINYCDAISLHAYPNNHYTDDTGNAYISSLNSYRNITGKDVWITETGQESGNDTGIQYSQQEQAAYFSTSYALLKSLNVKAYFWYELNDYNPGNSADFQNNSTFGLYDINSNNKTMLNVYFGLASTSTPTSSPTKASTPEPTLTILIATSATSAAVVLAGLLIYIKKRNH
jgi:hypothetical protein